eukprot:4750856-Amphidinium_carterae.1
MSATELGMVLGTRFGDHGSGCNQHPSQMWRDTDLRGACISLEQEQCMAEKAKFSLGACHRWQRLKYQPSGTECGDVALTRFAE